MSWKRFLVPVTYFPTNLVRKRFLLPITYFPTNLVYPFALRVTGKKIRNNQSLNFFASVIFGLQKQLIDKYPWFYLPPSVHKVLLHVPDIIRHSILSMGELSEEEVYYFF